MAGKFPQHTVKYKINGVWCRVEKVRYASEKAALGGVERLLADPSARIHPRGYNVYQCQHCHFWHVGRDGIRRTHSIERTERKIVLNRLYWALWRYANGKPVQRHSVRTRSPLTNAPVSTHSVVGAEVHS